MAPTTRMLRRLQKQMIRASRRQRRQARARKNAAPVATGPAISPLAAAGGFPALPKVAGVRLATAAAAIKYKGRDDVMLALCAPGTAMAGVTTRSATRAAPVLDCEDKVALPQSEAGAAIIVNAGNANAFTGDNGRTSVDAVTGAVAELLELPATRVFSSSTGVIGEPLKHGRILDVLAGLKASLQDGAFEPAARAIMTTDTFPKGAGAQVEIGGETVSIAGIAKGSGMIAPDMATMLVYVFTDARIGKPDLQRLVSDFNGQSFNRITVDGDTSTSDTLLAAATRQRGPELVAGSPEMKTFGEALLGVMTDLAHQVVRDGEGATKFVEIRVTGAASDDEAERAGRAIANSPLVKTAIAGEDPNWGRIVMAVGKAGVTADRDRLAIRFGDILVAERGWVAESYREADGAAYMQNPELVISVDLGLGTGAATLWTCDLTHAYISINADYRS